MSNNGLPVDSVWDYPRPPRIEPSTRRVWVEHGGVTIVDTANAVRVLETSHPPVYYVPRQDVRAEALTGSPRRSFCEFKGAASYWHLTVGEYRSVDAAWSYEDPSPGFEQLRGMIAFYPGRVDRCLLDDEAVEPQEGDFYGGWVTAEIVGPFKGGPGTSGW
jgi:uncharacterized protein (DUF427 family)